MPRDYYKEEKRDLSYSRDRPSKSSRRDARNEGRHSLSSNTGYEQRNDSRYGSDHHDTYNREKLHNSAYSRSAHERSQRDASPDYDNQSRNDRKKKRKKRKHSKERNPASDEPVIRSLVGDYDDVSPDSDISDSPPHQSSRRGHDKPRNHSPSITTRHKDRGHSPAVQDRSPESKKSRIKSSRPSDNRRQYLKRDQSPSHHPPQNKKARVHSPSPRRSR